MRFIQRDKINAQVKEYVLKACEFEELDNLGELMSYKKFIDYVNCGCLIDYDGWGQLVLNGKEVSNSVTVIHSKTMHIGGKLSVPFDRLYEIFGDDMKICWYNR